ncbi:MAG: phosphate ABC transporter, permease protein PstA, partial [Bacteroidia bacterium]|nr:phosphate ABC transporter, permease protein PstA [Bacteroidia bacterium]
MIISKKTKEQIAFAIFRILGIITLGVLIWILGFICFNGISVMSWDFIFSYPEEGMTSGGIFPAIVGTLYLVLGSIIIAFPLGVMSAIYTVEYAKNNWVTKLIRIMTNNLA